MRSWTVPGYTDVRELGRSGRGRTVLATHAATGTPVSIRYLADDLRGHERYLAGYRAGARVLAAVESPYIATMYEYVESDDGVATVREYVDGGSVRQLMATSGLHPEAALSVLNAGLQGLAAAHRCRRDPRWLQARESPRQPGRHHETGRFHRRRQRTGRERIGRKRNGRRCTGRTQNPRAGRRRRRRRRRHARRHLGRHHDLCRMHAGFASRRRSDRSPCHRSPCTGPGTEAAARAGEFGGDGQRSGGHGRPRRVSQSDVRRRAGTRAPISGWANRRAGCDGAADAGSEFRQPERG